MYVKHRDRTSPFPPSAGGGLTLLTDFYKYCAKEKGKHKQNGE